MWTFNISYGFGRKQDSKKLHKLTFCRCFLCSWIWGKIGNFLSLLQAFSTQIHQSAPSLHDDCFRSSGAGCSSTLCHARLAAFPILIAANAMGDTSLHRASNQKDWTHGWIFGSLRPQASQWKDTDYNMRSSDYMQYASHGFPGWFWTFWGICKVWLQTRMCLDAISQKIKQTHMCLVTRSNVRVCVWYLSTTNACSMYVWSQTISERECVRNVCGTCFLCFVCRQE